MNGKWYLGAMNDGLFIIDSPPQPGPVDYFCDVDHGVHVIAAMGNDRARAEEIIRAHNSTMDQAKAALGQCRAAALAEAARLVETYHEYPSTNDQNIAADIRKL